jgi:hypothetical protein
MDEPPFCFFDEPRIKDPPNVSLEYRDCIPRNKPYFEELWQRFQPLCPDSARGFLTTARDNFRGMVWQMHLTVLASKLPGFQKGGPVGPDFFVSVGPDIEHSPRRCAVECVSLRLTADYPSHLPRPGQPLPRSFGWGQAYDDYRVARIGEALRGKAKDRASYIEKGIVRAEDPYVIAVSLGELFEGNFELPDVVRATYAIGALVFAIPIDMGTGTPAGEGGPRYPPQFGIRRSAGRSLQENDFFVGSEGEGISGALYSDFYCAPTDGEDGRELVFVHNVFADAPIPFGSFPWGREYGPTISMVKDWRPPRPKPEPPSEALEAELERLKKDWDAKDE